MTKKIVFLMFLGGFWTKKATAKIGGYFLSVDTSKSLTQRILCAKIGLKVDTKVIL